MREEAAQTHVLAFSAALLRTWQRQCAVEAHVAVSRSLDILWRGVNAGAVKPDVPNPRPQPC